MPKKKPQPKSSVLDQILAAPSPGEVMYEDMMQRLVTPHTGQVYHAPAYAADSQTIREVDTTRANPDRGQEILDKINSDVQAKIAQMSKVAKPETPETATAPTQLDGTRVQGIYGPEKEVEYTERPANAPPIDPDKLNNQQLHDILREGDPRKRKEAVEELFGNSDNDPGFAMKALGVLGDIVSRPIYGTSEAGQSAIEALTGGQHASRIGDDLAKGFWRGFSGKEKTGPGELIQTAAETAHDLKEGSLFHNPSDPFSNLALHASSFFPTVGGSLGGEIVGYTSPDKDAINEGWRQKVMQGSGLYGEIFADPVNLIGIGTAAKVSGKGSRAVGTHLDSVVDSTTQANKVVHDAIKTANAKIDVANKVSHKAQPKSVAGGGSVARTHDEVIGDAVAKNIEEINLAGQVKTGTQANKRVGVNDPISAAEARSTYIIATRNELMHDVDDVLTKIDNPNFMNREIYDLEPTSKYRKSKAHKNKYANSEAYREFIDDFDARFKELDPEDAVVETVLREAAQDAKLVAEDTAGRLIAQTEPDFWKAIDEGFYNAPVIRLGSKHDNVKIEIPFLGQGYAKVRPKTQKVTNSDVVKSVSMDKTFGKPGVQAVAMARRNGLIDFELLTERIRGFAARTVDPKQRAEITRYLREGLPNNTAGIDEAVVDSVNFIRAEYKRLLSDEINMGVRKAGHKGARNYHYQHNHQQILAGKNKSDKIKGKRLTDKRSDWKEARKAEIRDQGEITSDWYQIAKDAGLKPEKDPFMNLLYRQQKANRDLSRGWLSSEIINTYGIKTKAPLGKNFIKQHDLVDITPRGGHEITYSSKYGVDDLAHFKLGRIQENSIKPGQHVYIPRSTADMYAHYDNLTSLNLSDESAALLRTYDAALRFFRKSATIPMPGFHAKNMAGDIMMGFLDGVRGRDFTRYERLRTKGKITLKTGDTITANDLDNAFDQFAGSSGYIQAELGLDSASQVNAGTRGVAKRIDQKATRLSETRENWSRKVHFLKAAEAELGARNLSWDEVRKILPTQESGTFTPRKPLNKLSQKEKATRSAMQAAGSRVDYYKFDYGSLTKFERQYLRRIIPFYTFTRKAWPVLMESMFMNPSVHGKLYRAYRDTETNLNTLVPEWIRELGYVRIAGGATPIVMPNNFLPTDVISAYVPDDPTNISSWGGDALDLASNPVLDTFLETGTRTDKFTGAPVGSSGLAARFFDDSKDEDEQNNAVYLANALGNMFPPLPAAAKLQDQTGAERLGSRWLTGLGIQEMSAEEQHKLLNSFNYDKSREIDRLNKQIENSSYYIYQSNSAKQGSILQVRDNLSDEILHQGTLPSVKSYLRELGLI